MLRLQKFLQSIKEHGLTLRKEKCKLGVAQVACFGMIYDKEGMSADSEKIRVIRNWTRPNDKAGVK